ncbi:uncharacterized protein LOC123525787 [Mercenaria mercenaria]|uniref:uncharacterized protein LOC123525787 n=1 Tax=Mercenaria mercenaria TaxID=6596 RepID=UPI00234EC3B8|nr:uncharacterized protein LOC123525787 [Mercenaria mercenaria]
MVQTMESPPFDLQAYQPPISLWKLVKQYVPDHEREEIKSMLGESLIDQSMELHEEIDTLLEIWRDYREETEHAKPMSKLPEPPGLRDRLIQEIQFFVDSVKEKAKYQGVNADKILSRHNTDILDYALDTYRPDSARPSSRLTARGNDGRETPMICSPTCSDRTSEASILSEEVEAMNEKLNILKFDEVVAHLRSTMEEEIETLLRDINFLQSCLDDEATFRAESTGTLSREPTLSELKEERSTLEKDLLSNMTSQSSPPLLKPAFTPASMIKKLGSGVTPSSKLKTPSSQSTGLSVPVKSGPMKAFVSPEPPKFGPIRTDSAGKPKTLPQQGIQNHRHLHQINDRLKSPETTNESSVNTRRSGSGSASSSLRQYRASSGITKHNEHISGDNNRKVSNTEQSHSKPKLEAVVTLSKGKTGDATDVHVIPSPPPSAKPTTPRPGSAQRFRKMVLECRDSSADTADDDDKNPLVEIDQSVVSDEAVKPLPVWRKICFAVGGAPYQTTNTVINFFISIFLLEVAKIPPEYASVILFAGKAWDAITDPTCGYLVHKTDSRFGKFRPWILLSAPFACGAYFCLWYVPDISDAGKFVWYFCFYCGFQMLLSGLHVPYTSMTMTVTNSQKDRDSVTAYRMVSEAFGVLLAVVVEGQLVGKYRKTGDCADNGEVSDDQIENEKGAYILGAVIVVSAYMICAFTVFFGSKEKHGFTTVDSVGFFSGAKQVLTFRPYVLLSTSFLFLSLAIAIVQGNLALFCTHTLKMGDDFSYFILVLLVSTILAMPFWQKCIVKFGKKSTFATGMIVFVPVLIVQLYIPEGEVYVYYPVVVVAGLGISVALLLPWSMLPDVIDEFVLKYGTRKESIFYSFYVFFSKLAVGVGLGVSQAVLAFGGYETGECNQPASVALALQMLVVPGPVIFTLIALVALWAYPINETRRKELKQAIHDKLRKREENSDIHTGKNRANLPSYLTDRDIPVSVSYKSITESSGV